MRAQRPAPARPARRPRRSIRDRVQPRASHLAVQLECVVFAPFAGHRCPIPSLQSVRGARARRQRFGTVEPRTVPRPLRLSRHSAMARSRAHCAIVAAHCDSLLSLAGRDSLAQESSACPEASNASFRSLALAASYWQLSAVSSTCPRPKVRPESDCCHSPSMRLPLRIRTARMALL